MPTTDVALINYEQVPLLPAGQTPAPTWPLLVRNPDTNEVWECELSRLLAALSPKDPVVVVPPPAPAIAGPTYHGAVASSAPTAAAVQALTAEQWAAAPRTVVASCNNTYPCFAEPASYPVRTLIQDVNGYNISGDFAVTTTTFSIGGTAVSYRVYTHQNPQYDPSFTLSL